MKVHYKTLYLYFSVGNKVFREELKVKETKKGIAIVDADDASTFKIYRFVAPTTEDLDKIAPTYSIMNSCYPMFSFSGNYEDYVKILNEYKSKKITTMEKELLKLKTEVSEKYTLEDR